MHVSASSAHIAAQTYATGLGQGVQRQPQPQRRVETADFVDLSAKAAPVFKRPTATPATPVRETQAFSLAAGEGTNRREAPLNRTDARAARPGTLLDIKV